MSEAAELPHDDVPAIAVTGLACRFPGADSAEEFWELLREGVDPREAVPEEDLRRAGRAWALSDPSYVAVRKRFADASLFDADYFGMSPAEAAVTDPQQRFLLETAVHALEDAGLVPASFPGRIGVYLGVNISDYLLQNVLAHPEAIEPLGFHRVLMGNDRGYTATQLSYRLGLTGPSLAVDCACSSSLAAVHHACRALMDYETDAAVVGGAAINPTDVGYAPVEGGISSPDGHCRPFSADARGTVFSSGAGLVVLRRLDEALEDGDRVLAVIRASGLNNDGSRKSGYTAPSMPGQAELIAEVHELAGVTADRISYVEAHATGTPLGDPIEVSALTEAFRRTTDAVGHCAIGSVKSNIGHLDSASGIAGLIKVVLSLRHRQLPATLGCERPNPHIDFDTSPFRVNTALRPWTGPRPLLAGVSSLGVGGTNVHLLVEEAPDAPGGPAGRPAAESRHLLLFSARSAASLDALEDAVRSRVAGSTPDDARDVAFTLATRRTLHPLRRGLLWRADGDPVPLDARYPESVPADRAPAVVLTDDVLPVEAVRPLLEGRPAYAAAVRRLTAQCPVPPTAPDADPLTHLQRTAPRAAAMVTALACAALWAEHGVRPGAVVATTGNRPAAAVISGVVADADAPRIVAALARGADPAQALSGVPLLTATIPWYDSDGAELCPAGRTPDAALLCGGVPADPGQRTLPPRLSVLLNPVPVTEPVPPMPSVFPEAVALTVPKDVRPGTEALLAALGQAWVMGLAEHPGRLALPDGSGRFTQVPSYPFERRRHWLEPRTQEQAAAPAAGSGGDSGEQTADALEQAARQIFAEATGRSGIDPADDLFSLGGDSLLATRIVAQARQRWGRRIPLGSFMEEPTPARLARLAAMTEPAATGGSASGATDPAQSGPAQSGPARAADPAPATSIQEAFLFLSEFEGAAEAFNVPVLADLRGPVDRGALRAALADLVARHETLRTVFRTTGGTPLQVVVDQAPMDVPEADVADDDALREAIAALLDTTIPTDRAPLCAARLFRMGPDRTVLALALHHLVADATSIGILLRDLYALYRARRDGGAPELPAIATLAARHARAEADWLTTAEADRQRAYWRRELADLPAPLELPGDRPRGARRSYHGDKLNFTLPSGTAQYVRALAAEESTTPFVVVLTAFSVLLSALSDQKDLLVGCPVSGRHRPETRDLIGNFVNTLPIRTTISAGQSFRSLLRDTARRVTGAMDHQELPFEVMARDAVRGPDGRGEASGVFQVLFNLLHPESMSPRPPTGVDVRPLPFERSTSPYELSLDWWIEDGVIGGRFIYDTDRFTRQTVDAWQRSFAFLLESLTRTPDTAVDSVAAEPPARAETTRTALTGPRVPVPDLPVHAVFAEHAARHPDREAVSDGRQTLTYGELARLSAGVADLVAAHGIGTGEPVGIALPRDARSVVALLGVLRAGATPVPLDLSYPRRRLAAVAEHCGTRLVLCDAAEEAEETDFVPEGVRRVALPPVSEMPARDGSAPGDRVALSVGAYLTYTSGTTGRPKGIHFPHGALANLIHWETDGYTRQRRWLQFASFGFDAAFHETFGALCSGGSVHIADEETRHDHDALAEFVRRHRVEKAILPVSLAHALATRFEKDPSPFASVREIATTGEQLRLSASMVAFFDKLGSCRLINNYGPAETHVVTSYTFTGPPQDWPRYAPIGRPVQNVTLGLESSDGLRAVPWGSVGELVIGGPCVATGYLGDPGLTKERFAVSADGVRQYRSGDRARLLSSGDVEFLGRRDQQVKIRGYRVEPGEIEVVIREDPGIADVALVVRGPEGDRRIDAYLVPVAGGEEIGPRTRRRLSEVLPPALVPSTFTVVDRLPVNANGKVDHALLPAPGTAGAGSGVRERRPEQAPSHGHGHDGEVLVPVLDAFRRVLDQPGLGPDDDFFEAGGHSLLATRLVHTVREELGVRLSVADFYASGTARDVADLVAGRRRLGAEHPEEELPPAATAAVLPPGLAALADRPGPDRQKTAVYDTGRRLDPQRLRDAVAVLLERQPALRLRVGESDRAEPADPAAVVADAVVRLRLPDDVPSGRVVDWLYEHGQAELIDPRTGPLVRVCTVDGPEGGTLLAVTVHLLALDGRGLDNLCRTLAEAYAQPTAPREADDGFLRYLAWRNALPGSRRHTEAVGLWRGLLAPLAGAPRPAVRPVREPGRRVWAPDALLQTALRARCAQQRITPFTLHLTAFGLALSRLGGAEAVCPAVPLDGRFLQRLDGSVGAFANIVPMPLAVPGDQPLGRILEGARQVVDQVLSVGAVPYADLAATHADLAGFDDLGVVFNYARDDEPLRFGTGTLREVGPDPLAPGRRLHMTVVDSRHSFRALLRHDAAAGDEGLLTLYRQALYGLVFDPEAAADSLDRRGAGG
ncbi:non-ribosomal peptide synthetase [Streptomyces cyanogenus]|uniref:Surfactin synthase subunit 1 n=1 Tax=Streptomyces cyanogenus TaxID=80860 RepID=A0ABX7TSH8_STRCY|nr:non-ribosomal peptide synthetase [Streptomyces cyanogenus]QTD99692.1 Surfactin synthase subunit 1 [Streptomyces cyanogenus]